MPYAGPPSRVPISDPRCQAIWEARVARSLLGDDGFLCLEHNAGPSSTRLWWGPQVPLRDGDRVYYFKTANGNIAVESVVTPEGLPTLNTIV